MEELEQGEQVEGGVSTSMQDYLQQQPKRYRHTAHQIQEMEAKFKECSHPNNEQRMQLSQDLGLNPYQVKYWFANQRQKMKIQKEREVAAALEAENDYLKNEKQRLQDEIQNAVCSKCAGCRRGAPGACPGNDEQQLRLENFRLKAELERVSALVSQYIMPPIQAKEPALSLLLPPLELYVKAHSSSCEGDCTKMIQTSKIPKNSSRFCSDGVQLIMEQEKALALKLAMSSMDELIKMCFSGEPLWIRPSGCDQDVLNVEEYKVMIQGPPSNNQHPSYDHLRTEASRGTSVVMMNSTTLVDAFLDSDIWVELFPSIISRARKLQQLSIGVSGHASGSLHLMYAELQVASPLVPTRESHFLRYFHQNTEGTWAIVDFPFESLRNNYSASCPIYKRHPSGCIIQDMPDGFSKVTWVEHAEVTDHQVHQIFNEFFRCGVAFGAQRWLAALERQCQRLASLMARNVPDLGVIPSPEARTNLMNLAHWTTRTFCISLSNSCGQSWTNDTDSLDDTIKIRSTRATGPSQPNGLILTAVSTASLPYHHCQVFDLLRDGCYRAQLDVLSIGNSFQEVAHIATGSNPGNCISLLHVKTANKLSSTLINVELMLQESCTDESGSLVTYTILNTDAIQQAMNGQDPSHIPILPHGFVIVPVGPSKNCGATTQDSYCLLTIGLQVLASAIPTAKLDPSSFKAINNHLCNTMQQISVTLSGNSGRSSDENNAVGGSSSEERPLALKEEGSASTPKFAP